MATEVCPRCDTQLDSVPAGAPCPRCGAQRLPPTVDVAGSPIDMAMVMPTGFTVIVQAALAELAAMPADAAQAILEEAKRRLAAGGDHRSGSAGPVTGVGTIRVIGVRGDAFVIPANARTWRDLLAPTADEIRRAVLNAVVATTVSYLVSQGACAHPVVGGPDAFRPPPAIVEREPTSAPPPPPLVGPADAASDDSDE